MLLLENNLIKENKDESNKFNDFYFLLLFEMILYFKSERSMIYHPDE
jgi:hypothetical protein